MWLQLISKKNKDKYKDKYLSVNMNCNRVDLILSVLLSHLVDFPCVLYRCCSVLFVVRDDVFSAGV